MKAKKQDIWQFDFDGNKLNVAIKQLSFSCFAFRRLFSQINATWIVRRNYSHVVLMFIFSTKLICQSDDHLVSIFIITSLVNQITQVSCWSCDWISLNVYWPLTLFFIDRGKAENFKSFHLRSCLKSIII